MPKKTAKKSKAKAKAKPKGTGLVKTSVNKKPENLVKDLEKSGEDFEMEILDPTSHAPHSMASILTYEQLLEMARMFKLFIPSTKVAKYLWDNSEEIRNRYKELEEQNGKLVLGKDGLPVSLSRLVRRLREKMLPMNVRFPQFNMDVYISKMVEPMFDALKEIQVMIAFQKERIGDAHATEKRIGFNNPHTDQSLLILRQLVLDFVRLCQMFGIEAWTSYRNFSGGGSYDQFEKSEEYIELSAKLEKFGDKEIQNLVLQKATKVYTLTRPVSRQE